MHNADCPLNYTIIPKERWRRPALSLVIACAALSGCGTDSESAFSSAPQCSAIDPLLEQLTDVQANATFFDAIKSNVASLGQSEIDDLALRLRARSNALDTQNGPSMGAPSDWVAMMLSSEKSQTRATNDFRYCKGVFPVTESKSISWSYSMASENGRDVFRLISASLISASNPGLSPPAESANEQLSSANGRATASPIDTSAPTPDTTETPSNDTAIGDDSSTASFDPVNVPARINDADGFTNVRSGPSASSEIVGRAFVNDELLVAPTGQDWWMVRLPSGTEGYMHRSRIELKTGSDKPAVAPAPSVESKPNEAAGVPSPATEDFGPSEDITGRRLNPPRYPPQEARRCIGGVVEVEVLVSSEGQVLDVAVSESSRNRNLDRAAMEAARMWKFFPGRQNGQPVGGKIRTTVTFTPPC